MLPEVVLALIVFYLTLAIYFRKNLLNKAGSYLKVSLWHPGAFVCMLVIQFIPVCFIAGFWIIYHLLKGTPL